MSLIPEIIVGNYRYNLPDSLIPNRPFLERDKSRLLLYKQGTISYCQFKDICDHLPSESFLVFNNSKVIPARILFQTATGALVEVLCLNSLESERQENGKSKQAWKCIVGNLKRWKQGTPLEINTNQFHLKAHLIQKGGEDNTILFEWSLEFTFLEILEKLGKIPLPPYMNRAADEEDEIRYQTVYASTPGSVAAPTAGLHFTEDIISQLRASGHGVEYVTLHVGAGTFKPVKSEKIADHKMHEELFEVDIKFIRKLLQTNHVIAVGTTSLRTLESLFYLGSNILQGKERMEVNQWDGFTGNMPDVKQSLQALLDWMLKTNQTKILAQTSIIIVPGYKFKVCHGLITNFHQPESTLILLVAAFLGEEWRKVYDYALQNKFRFLSYGDSSLLLP